MTYSSIKSLVYLYTKTNSTSLPDTSMVLYANTAFDRVVSLILQSDNSWDWDDTNNTDLPIATTDLVNAQQDYALSASFLEILRIEIKDTQGNWRKLTPFDQTQLPYQSLTDFMKTNNTPIYYRKSGSSIFLYPAPNYAQASSLKVYYQRPPNYFVSGDTTKEPGFNSLYHVLIPLWISYQYSVANGRQNANQIMADIQLKEAALQEDYSTRAMDEPFKISIKRSLSPR